MSITKVVVAGIGGVGGWLGGLLAAHYRGSKNVEIHFIARGAHLDAIRREGLRIVKGDHTFIAHPAMATDKPSETGHADFIIIATKSYDLEAMLVQLQPCIGKDTVILPLLNGIDSTAVIRCHYPGHIVAEGCVYIVSRLKETGLVVNTGTTEKLFFGIDGHDEEKLTLLEHILQQAGIEAVYSKNITSVIWGKFIFLSPLATATSYLDKNIGTLLSCEEDTALLLSLIGEVKQLADASGVTLPADIADRTISRIRALPFETTTSMHSDLQSGKPVSELESITGYVVRRGEALNVSVPAYREIYEQLRRRKV